MRKDQYYVVMSGRMVKDPMEFSDGNVAVFTVANNKSSKNGKDDVIFQDCVAFGDNAEKILADFKKGSGITVIGEINKRKSNNKDYPDKLQLHVATFSFYNSGSGKQKDNKEKDQELETSEYEDEDLPF